jgi:CubicO group peptidase (beta-lactamase class C family)
MWRCVLLGWIALCADCSAQSLDSRLQSYLAGRCQGGKFMGAVAMVQKGKPLLESACGLGNAEWNAPNTVDTKFRIASITKEFTAAAILLLQQEQRLSVRDPISRYVDDLPQSWRPVTLHQLLTHTSGIPSYTDGPVKHLNRMGATPKQLLDLVRDKPLSFQPGDRFYYNNTGYILLGMVIEKASGLSYAQFVRQRLLVPAGMENSGFDDSAIVLPNRAAGYIFSGGLRHAEPVDASVPWSAGGLYSTVGDLVKWAEVLAGGRILNAEQQKTMFNSNPEAKARDANYGYGIVITRRFNRGLRYHGGGINGFTSVLQHYPDDALVVAVLSNMEGEVKSWELADGLTAILFDQ